MTESGNHELGEPPRPIQTPLSRATELPKAVNLRIRYCAQRTRTDVFEVHVCLAARVVTHEKTCEYFDKKVIET